MEYLFTTTINFNSNSANYLVYFSEEQYIFQPEAKDKNLPFFSFKREHDEWHEQNVISPLLKKQAIDALENYLMAQH